MFCWSWLAGYLQRGLGIPPAGRMARWRDGRGGEGGGGRTSASMCLPCTDINLDRILFFVVERVKKSKLYDSLEMNSCEHVIWLKL